MYKGTCHIYSANPLGSTQQSKHKVSMQCFLNLWNSFCFEHCGVCVTTIYKQNNKPLAWWPQIKAFIVWGTVTAHLCRRVNVEMVSGQSSVLHLILIMPYNTVCLHTVKDLFWGKNYFELTSWTINMYYCTNVTYTVEAGVYVNFIKQHNLFLTVRH